MAADLEQIFQDFILNKIKEIEDQNEEKKYVTVVFSFLACVKSLKCYIRVFKVD